MHSNNLQIKTFLRVMRGYEQVLKKLAGSDVILDHKGGGKAKSTLVGFFKNHSKETVQKYSVLASTSFLKFLGSCAKWRYCALVSVMEHSRWNSLQHFYLNLLQPASGERSGFNSLVHQSGCVSAATSTVCIACNCMVTLTRRSKAGNANIGLLSLC